MISVHYQYKNKPIRIDTYHSVPIPIMATAAKTLIYNLIIRMFNFTLDFLTLGKLLRHIEFYLNCKIYIELILCE